MKRPRLDPTVAKTLRAHLRSLHGGGLNPRAATAVTRSTPETILTHLGGNPIRVWDAAWSVDAFACNRRVKSVPDGGTYDLATVLYDYAVEAAGRDLTGDHGMGRRWRDVYPSTPPGPTVRHIGPLVEPRYRPTIATRWE